MAGWAWPATPSSLSSVPLPVLGLRDLPERLADQCQSDLWAPGEAHPGRRKKMAEPSFPQSNSVNTGRMRRWAAWLGPNLITGRARKPPPPSRRRRVCSTAVWKDPWPISELQPSTSLPLLPWGSAVSQTFPAEAGRRERRCPALRVAWALSLTHRGERSWPGIGGPVGPQTSPGGLPAPPAARSWGSRPGARGPGAQLLGRHAY